MGLDGNYRGFEVATHDDGIALVTMNDPDHLNEALSYGLVHEVVADELLLDHTMELARELADGPQVAMRLLKRSLYNADEMPLAQAFDDIAGKTGISDHHPDAAEGVASFREKRKAEFNKWLEPDG